MEMILFIAGPSAKFLIKSMYQALEYWWLIVYNFPIIFGEFYEYLQAYLISYANCELLLAKNNQGAEPR